MITQEDVEKVYSLFKWIEPSAGSSPQVWVKGKIIRSNVVYKIQYTSEITKLFFKLDQISEPNWIKIYKKRKGLEHLTFTIKNKNNKWWLIWE